MNSGSDDFEGEYATLIEALRRRALQRPEHRVYSYLIDGEAEGDHLTFGELDRQARTIGGLLQSYGAGGARALLIYPSGLEFIAAFFGCLYAGVAAVPVAAPNLAQAQRALPRLRAIMNDARPALVLTTASIKDRIEGLIAEASATAMTRWVATNGLAGAAAAEWQDPGASGDSLALLQYTSGATTTPRGVMISHANLLHNSARISGAFGVTAETVSVTWLPTFHDMGLTNGIIQPLLNGRECYLMPPQSFLQRPIRWLQAISRYGASISGGPNFAYELCVRRIAAEHRESLDLSGWRVAYTGAEPVRAETLQRFAEAFGVCGFRQHFFYPCYGLAEATLMVSGGELEREPKLLTIETGELERNRIVPGDDPQSALRTLVGCGQAIPDSTIAIVDPESMTMCAPDEVGEIWVAGGSVGRGYWDRAEDTEKTFHGYVKDTAAGPFLRTGDLGFVKDGELFVTGRLKDLIIIDGRNLYPQDIELTVEQSHAGIRPAGCAAFSVEMGEERLVIAAELERRYQSRFQNREARHERASQAAEIDLVVKAIRRAVAEEHDVRVHAVVLLSMGSLPRTPSGKLQRRACRERFLKGTLAGLRNASGRGQIYEGRVAAPVDQ